MSTVPDVDLLRRVLGAALAKEQLPWYARILMSFSGPYLSAIPTKDGPVAVTAGGRWVRRLKFLYDPEEKTVEVVSYVGGPWEDGISGVLDMLRRLGINLGSPGYRWPEIAGFGTVPSPSDTPPAVH
ncbi:MAG: hypothetical protein CL878_04105 [Dehalococcoidia bacterium]|nr:hypothetical protein [Dehalococcoidia bacterium]